MGIINVTPDSFYAGSRTKNAEAAVIMAEKMMEEGADLLDIGGYSSRPGAENISPSEESKRLIPAISAVRNRFPEALISADTFRSEVAGVALKAGADIINDISGGADEKMFKTVARANAGYILMHMVGTPQTMAQFTGYDQMIPSITQFFSDRLQVANDSGVQNIVLDPGFGFSKTIDQNYELLYELSRFRQFNRPLLVGISRKSMIYKTLGCTPEESLPGTTALHLFALLKGAGILRVHDVREARGVIELAKKLSLNLH